MTKSIKKLLSLITLIFLQACASKLAGKQVTLENAVNVNPPDLKGLSKKEFTDAGYDQAYSACNNYFDALIKLKNDTAHETELVGAAGTAATTIMGLANIYSPTVGIASAGFGFISSYFGSFNKNELLTPYPEETMGLILHAMNRFRDENPATDDTTASGAILRVRQYAQMCTYSGISSYAKEALTKSTPKPDPNPKTQNKDDTLAANSTKPIANTPGIAAEAAISAASTGANPSAIGAAAAAAGAANDAGATKTAAIAAGQAAASAASTPGATPASIGKATTNAATSAGATAGASAAAGAAAVSAESGKDPAAVGVAATTAAAATTAGAPINAATAAGIAAGEAANNGAPPAAVGAAASGAALREGAAPAAASAAGAAAGAAVTETSEKKNIAPSDSITTISPN